MLSGSRPATSGQQAPAVFTDRGSYNRQGVETAKSQSSNKMPQINQKDNIVPPIQLKSAKNNINLNDASGSLTSKGASARNQIVQPSLKTSMNSNPVQMRPQTQGVVGSGTASMN